MKKQYCTGKIFKPLALMGRRALIIYAVHQPILIALIWIWRRIIG
ncbi:MAG: hypothetical protein ACOX2H_05675 [Saccharofermentanales bacterium]